MKREHRHNLRWTFQFIAGISAALTVYLAWIRPRQLRWGATRWELIRPMEGDDDVRQPNFIATRAITIKARPDQVWPWIVQMGFGRAGWYSYDWVDNLGKPSARRIIPGLQSLKAGDIVPFSPDGKSGVRVKAFKEPEWMLWEDIPGKKETTWCWGLYPLRGDATRLVTRLRLRYDWKSPIILLYMLLDAGDFFMMRKCMLGIKERAETLARSVHWK